MKSKDYSKTCPPPSELPVPPVSTKTITLTWDDWKNLRIIMRSLTWGHTREMKAWSEIVKSVEARKETE